MSQDLENKVTELSQLKELFAKKVTKELREDIKNRTEEINKMMESIKG